MKSILWIAALCHLVYASAIGCPDIVPPRNAWLKKNGAAITVGCHASTETWQLKCVGKHWIGFMGNCSKADIGILGVYKGKRYEFVGQKKNWTRARDYCSANVGDIITYDSITIDYIKGVIKSSLPQWYNQEILMYYEGQLFTIKVNERFSLAPLPSVHDETKYRFICQYDIVGFPWIFSLVVSLEIWVLCLVVAITVLAVIRRKNHIDNTIGIKSQVQELRYINSNSIHVNRTAHVPEDPMLHCLVNATHAQNARAPLQLLPDTNLTGETISKESSATTRDAMQKPGIALHQESDTENPCYSGYKEINLSETAYNGGYEMPINGYEVPDPIQDAYLHVDPSERNIVEDRNAENDAPTIGVPKPQLPDMYLTCKTMSKENGATATDTMQKPGIILHQGPDNGNLSNSGYHRKNGSKETDNTEAAYNDGYEVPISGYEVPISGNVVPYNRPLYEEIS